MTGATMCSGIGAPEVAAPEIDWQFCAEIEPFPSAVLKHYRPDVPNLGNIMAADFIDRAKAFGQIDVLVAGTPCQAFSVAGLRKSLDDERGNLTLRFVEIVHAIEPITVVWENVPGVLNTPDNAFGCFLGAMVGANTALIPPSGLRWTDAGVVDGPARVVAWRVLDAQYFGLAQRRERVFVVASLRDGPHPCEVLFEREGVQRHFAPRRETGEGVAPTVTSRLGDGGSGHEFDVNGGLVAERERESSMRGCESTVEYDMGPQVTGITSAGMGQREGRQICDDIAPAQDPITSDDVMLPLEAKQGQCVAFDTTQITSKANRSNPKAGDPCHPLAAGAHPPALATTMAVRRLTPTECERLQGFPDSYTNVPFRGKEAADGPRYRSLGNSMAVPVLRWILRRLAAEAQCQ